MEGLHDAPQPIPVHMTRKYTELMHRVIISNAVMISSLEVPEMFGPLKERVFHKNVTGRTPLFEILNSGVLKGVRQGATQEALQIFAKGLAEQAAVNVEMVVSSAVIVLSHSTADDVFTGACQLGSELAPNDWISELNPDRTVRLRDLKEKGRDMVFQEELSIFRGKIGNKSLPTRADLFFKHVKIRHHREIPPTSPEYFRASELKVADDLRNQIVHGGVLPHIPMDRAFELTKFLHEAATTALRSMAYAFPIMVDDVYIQELLKTKNPGVVPFGERIPK